MRLRLFISLLLTLTFITPVNSAQAEEFQVACSGGGSYTIVMPDGLAINGLSCTGALVLDNRVKKIAREAFAYSKVTTVEIPDSIMEIGWYAFASAGLESLKLSNSLTEISPGAFQFNKLKQVVIPAGVKWISAFGFKGNPLEVVNFSEGLKGIDSEAFANTLIASLFIPSTVIEIGSRAFANIPTLVSVDLSDKLEPGISIATNIPTIGDVFDQSYNIARILYCGSAQGFLVKPICEGDRKVVADKAAKEVADEAAKEEAERAARVKEFEAEQTKSIAETLYQAGMSATSISFKVTGQKPVCPVGSIQKDLSTSKSFFGITIICNSIVKPEAERLALIAADKKATELKIKEEADQKAKQEADAKAAADKVVADAKAEAARILAEAKAKASEVMKKTTITCVKGKLTKKVTAIKPVCPKGYKKK
jgi:hypothetical protein